MRALEKDFLREVQHSKSRFLSIFILAALAVAFLSGLRATAPDMKQTIDSYMDEAHFMDVQVLSTLGLTEDDISALAAEPTAETAEGVFLIDAFASAGKADAEGSDAVVKVYSLPEELNRLTVLEGRLPEAEDECVADKLMLTKMDAAVGDTVKLRTQGTYADSLARTEFTVVGVVQSPFYISVERGTSTLGTGQAAAFLCLPESAFAMDYYTAAYLTVNGAAEEVAFSDAYQALVDASVSDLEALAKVRAPLRRQEIVNEANEKLSDAQRQLTDAKAETDAQLSDAWKKLLDARKKLDDGWREYRDGQETLARETESGEQRLADAEQELADALVTLNDNEAAYADGLAKFQDGRQRYEDSLAQYQAGLAKYEDGLAQYRDGAAQLAAGRQRLESGEAEYEAGVAELQERLTPLALVLGRNPEELVNGLLAEDPETEEAVASFFADADAALAALRDAAAAAPLPDGEEIGGAIAWLAEKTAALEELIRSLPESEAKDAAQGALRQLRQRLEEAEADPGILEQYRQEVLDAIDAQRASLRDSEAQFRDGVDQLIQGRKTLDDGWAEYRAGEAELADARRQLTDSRRQLDEAEAQLTDAQKILDESEVELADARARLDEGWQQYRDGMRELADGRVTLAEETARAKARLADAWKKLQSGEAEYADGLAQYEDGKREAEETIADYQRELAAARRKVADIESCQWYVMDRSSNPGYLGFGQDADRMGNLASVFPVLFFLVAALVCLTTMTRMVEEQRTQIGCLKALGYRRWQISRKYLGYGMLPSLLGSVLGLAIGYTLFPKMIFTAYQIMYAVPDIQLHQYTDVSLLCVAAAVLCTGASAAAACGKALREVPASLMRPRAPAPGKRVFLEYIRPLWRRLDFNHKVTARNLFRYQKRFWMTVAGIAGCTALIIAGFGLRSSLLSTMDRQYGDIYRYTAQLTLHANSLAEEREEVAARLASDARILASEPCYLASMTAETEKYNTMAYLEVADPETFGDFVEVRDYRTGETLQAPADGTVLIDEKLSELLGVTVGDRFTLAGDTREELTVSGIYEHYLAHFVYMSPGSYEKIYGEPYTPNAYLLRLTDDSSETCDAVFSDLMDLGGVAAATRMLDTRDTYHHSMERIDFVVVIVILSAAALALVVLYNLSNINITERKRELATIKVLGFYDREVSAYVNRENVVLTAAGIAAGILLGRWLHMWLVRSVEIDLMMFGRETDPMAYLWAALLTAGFSLLVNGFGYRKMRKIDMVESLKSAE